MNLTHRKNFTALPLMYECTSVFRINSGDFIMSQEIIQPSANSKKTWSVGTLTYTASGLAILFLLLLWGDFAWSMRDRTVMPVAQILTKQKFGMSDFLYSLIVISFPNFTNIFLMPTVSYLSDRHRGKWGRRIPFLLFTTPFIVVGLIGLGLTDILGQWLNGITGWNLRACQLTIFGIFWVLLDFGTTLSNAIFNALVNDVVPQKLIGRFFGLFRIISLGAGILFNAFLIGEAQMHFCPIFIGIGILYAVGLTSLCIFVKEGSYPPPEDIPAEKTSNFSRVFGAMLDYFRQSFSIPFYRWIIVTLLLGSIAFQPINNFSIQFATSMGVNNTIYGKLLAITYAFSICLSFPLGILADRFHPIRTGLVSLIGYALTMISGSIVLNTGLAASIGSFCQAHPVSSLWGWFAFFDELPPEAIAWSIIFILHGVVSGCYFTLTASIALRLFPRSLFAQFNSANSLITSMGTMSVGGPMIGLLLDLQLSNYLWIFPIATLITFLTILGYFKILSYYNRFGGDTAYLAPNVITKEERSAAQDPCGNLLIPGLITGIILGIAVSFFFMPPGIRENYSYASFFENIFTLFSKGADIFKGENIDRIVVTSSVIQKAFWLSIAVSGGIFAFFGAMLPGKKKVKA